ncbi:MAG: hypothetical protein ACI92S_004222, partial [Planctomycetaceae bacterium]
MQCLDLQVAHGGFEDATISAGARQRRGRQQGRDCHETLGQLLTVVEELETGLRVVGGSSHSWSGELLQLRDSTMQML